MTAKPENLRAIPELFIYIRPRLFLYKFESLNAEHLPLGQILGGTWRVFSLSAEILLLI